MKVNMGTVDRVIRIAIALAIVVLFLTYEITGVTAIVFIALAVVMVVTSLVSFCPLYAILHINTAKKLKLK